MSAAKLYTPEVLSLATRLALFPLDPAMPHQGRARSQSCGSALKLSLRTDDSGVIDGIGVAAQACAVGQASAAIFAGEACGKTAGEIAAALQEIESWLAQDGPQPAWPGLSAIAAAQHYPARHGAVMLPWRAALDALSESQAAS